MGESDYEPRDRLVASCEAGFDGTAYSIMVARKLESSCIAIPASSLASIEWHVCGDSGSSRRKAVLSHSCIEKVSMSIWSLLRGSRVRLQPVF